ncbi:hypothetical protein RBI98_09570 [Citrobacter koseri]|nr:hypothetical protein [Citrobacter koseri]MDQ2325033.1 hypothetical protein [Citrobacter koseri]
MLLVPLAQTSITSSDGVTTQPAWRAISINPVSVKDVRYQQGVEL